MYDDYKLMKHIEMELDKKAESGFRNSSDLDTVVKLAQIQKDLAKAKYYCTVTEAMEQEGYSHNDGDYSERRRRDARGRYSRNDGYDRGSSYNDGHGGYSAAHDRYMEKKHSYRTSRTPEAKRELLDSMEDFLDELETMFRETKSGADTREERDKIQQRVRDMVNKM